MAEQLLGSGSFVDPRAAVAGVNSTAGDKGHDPGYRCRGIYCTLPEEPGTPREHAARQANFENDLEPVHWDCTLELDDKTTNRFYVTGLIDDTPAGAGGFTLFPRTHARHCALAQRVRSEGLDPRGEEARRLQQELTDSIKADTEPIDCFGPAGTIVLWHARTAHRVAANYSDTIRQAVIYVSGDAFSLCGPFSAASPMYRLG